MSETLIHSLAVGLVSALSALLLFSCDDKLHVRQEYDFSLTSWHLPKAVKPGEEVEIRFTLTREGDYLPARYDIGYIQMDGEGEVRDAAGRGLVSREYYPLEEMPGLNRDDPTRQVFTLYYRSLSEKPTQVKFVVEDNFRRQRECTVGFQNENE